MSEVKSSLKHPRSGTMAIVVSCPFDNLRTLGILVTEA